MLTQGYCWLLTLVEATEVGLEGMEVGLAGTEVKEEAREGGCGEHVQHKRTPRQHPMFTTGWTS